MIEARIFEDGVEIGRVRIEKDIDHADETADYTVEFGVDRAGAVGMHVRMVRYFPRLQYNALALLLQALNTLEPKELELEPDARSSNLARRLRGIGSAFPREAPNPDGHH